MQLTGKEMTGGDDGGDDGFFIFWRFSLLTYDTAIIYEHAALFNKK